MTDDNIKFSMSFEFRLIVRLTYKAPDDADIAHTHESKF